MSEHLFVIERDGAYGYCDAAGTIVVEPTFRGAQEWSEGTGLVLRRARGGWAYVDRSGRPRFGRRSFLRAWPFREERALAQLDAQGTFAFLDPAGGVAFEHRSKVLESFSGGRTVLATDRCGYVDRDGRLRIPLEFEAASGFSEGLAAVRTGGRWGFVTDEGALAIAPRFEQAGPFAQERAPVAIDSRWGFVDPRGAIAIPARFEDVGGFCDGLAPVRECGAWRYIDRTGATRIAGPFEHAFAFAQQRAAIVIGGKYGFIDEAGKIVISPEWDSARSFDHGLAQVGRRDRRGVSTAFYVDRESRVAWPH